MPAKPSDHSSGPMVPLQNGVEATSQLCAVIDERHVVAGLCGVMSWVTGPGQIRTVGDLNFIRLELDNRRSERTEALRQVFEQAGVKAEIPDDFTRRCGKNSCSSYLWSASAP